MTVKALPRSSLEVVEAEFSFQLLMGLLADRGLMVAAKAISIRAPARGATTRGHDSPVASGIPQAPFDVRARVVNFPRESRQTVSTVCPRLALGCGVPSAERSISGPARKCGSLSQPENFTSL